MYLRGELKVGTLGAGVHEAGHVAEATVDAFGHIHVLVGGLAAATGGGLSLGGDGLDGANSCTNLIGKAGSAPLQMGSGTMRAALPPCKRGLSWPFLSG